METTYYIARVKKPHRKFNAGDLLVGTIEDGMGDRLVCSGWSTKVHSFMYRYSLRYRGFNQWRDAQGKWHEDITGSGHLTIIGQFSNQGEPLDELSKVKSHAQFIQQLSLYGGNVLGS